MESPFGPVLGDLQDEIRERLNLEAGYDSFEKVHHAIVRGASALPLEILQRMFVRMAVFLFRVENPNGQ
jgi:hypothetical protein